MSYSANVKREIFNLENSDKDTVYAELFGIFIAKNVITEHGIYFSTENVSLAKRIYSNLRAVTNIPIQLKYVISKRLGTIRGFFLSCGYIKSPEKAYAMDFFVDTEDSATYLYYLFKQMGKKVFQTEKKNKSLVYLRNSEDILDIIFLIGGINSFFEFEEVTINKEIRNKINRNMNWEIANETKKLSASEKQIHMIKVIDEKMGLSELTDVLSETARVRLENQEMSLQELADLMEISKSGIKNRFRRLETIYKGLVEN